MSGHSKWSTIKHKKGAADARRSKIFTKLIKEITVAARIGGGDQNTNPRLRKAVADARGQNMPGDNIDRAIKRGTGELDGVHYEEVSYEAYGPGGVGIICEVVTDNRNRTVAEMRNLIEKNNGKFAQTGAVSFQFHRRGVLAFDSTSVSEDKLMEIAIDVGADDVKNHGAALELYCDPMAFNNVREGVEKNGLKPMSAEIAMVPQSTIHLDGKEAEQMIKLMNVLEDHDDVQHVWANFDIDEHLMERLHDL